MRTPACTGSDMMSPTAPLVSRSVMAPIALPIDEPEELPDSTAIDPESSFALVVRARAGDESAVEQLFARYSTRMQRWAHGRLPQYARSYGDTRDLVQDTMIQVYKSLDRFEPRHAGAFFAFVRRTLQNKLVDRVRAAKSRGVLEPMEDVHASALPSPHEETVAAALLERYEQSLNRLKPQHQEAIFARIELGLPWAEVMDVLHKPTIAAAQMTVHRAILALAREMEHERCASDGSR
jgi:RNA polymerase sigma-70 factor, ECF subfamily